MNNFHGKGKRRNYFEGWYLKQQNETDTISLIPAFHVDQAGIASASLQIVTEEEVHQIDFQEQQFQADQTKFLVHLGNNVFSEHGCKLDVRTKNCTLQGTLRFDALIKPTSDMMGPFRFVPFLECRHSVLSLSHRVDGMVTMNGRQLLFENGRGYLEGDRGSSFPERYLWSQCTWDGNSLMLSVARIPYAGFHFTGCVGFVYYDGKEHRIATYCGAKPVSIHEDSVLVRQGELALSIKLIKSRCHPLRAPQSGSMTRTIYESASCQVQYTCSIGKRTLFDFTSEQASFEASWPESSSR